MFTSDIAIDLGSSRIRIFMPNKGVVVDEPSIIAMDSKDKSVVAIGKEAYNMLGRTGENIEFKKPFSGGLVTDLTMAEYMFARYIKRIGVTKLMLPNVVVTTPKDTNQVQKHAITDVFERSGIRKIKFMDDILAGIKGAGVDIKYTTAVMSINIGHYYTNVAVVEKGEILSWERIKTGGMDFTYSLMEYMIKAHGLEIGELVAEEAKREIGGVSPKERATYWHVRGKNIHTGLPQDQLISSDETVEIFSSPITKICDSIEKCIEFLPKETLTDIASNQILLFGGGAKLFGMDKYFQRKFNVPVKLCPEADITMVYGAALK